MEKDKGITVEKPKTQADEKPSVFEPKPDDVTKKMPGQDKPVEVNVPADPSGRRPA